MIKYKNNIFLKEVIEAAVKEILSEQAEDVVLADPLVAIFIQPFTDVIKTANAEIKKNLINIKGNTKSFIKQAAIMAIPFLSIDMINDTHEEAQKEIEKRLGRLNKEYADVYRRNWETLRSRDIWGIGFMLNPAQGVAAKFAMKAPSATLNILKTLTAGSLSQKNQQRLQKAMDFAANFSQNASPNYGGSVSYGGGGYGSGGGFDAGYFDGDFSGELGGEAKKYSVEKFLQEQEQKNNTSKQDALKKIGAFIEVFKKQPDVQNAIQNSSVSKELRQAAYDAIMKSASPVLKANSYEQLVSALGPNMKKFEEQINNYIPKDLEEAEKEKIKQEMVPQIKNEYKKILTTQLMKQKSNDEIANKNLQKIIAQINQA